MNQITRHEGKNTFKSLVGVEIEELFPLKEDDAYLDEVISKKINLNAFYDIDAQTSKYFQDYQGKKTSNLLEERLIKGYEPMMKVCGFHKFFMTKHLEILAFLGSAKSIDNKSPDNKLRSVLSQYLKFISRFWRDNHFKFFSDLPIINELIYVVFDDDFLKMQASQLEICTLLFSILKFFSQKSKLNECLNLYLRDKPKREAILVSYQESCRQLLGNAIKPNLGSIPKIYEDPQRAPIWNMLVKLLVNYSNENCEEEMEKSLFYSPLMEALLIRLFLDPACHQETIQANDNLFYALSLLCQGLHSRLNSQSLNELLYKHKEQLYETFNSHHHKWSKSMMECFVVFLLTNLGEECQLNYRKMPRYRVLKKYNEEGLSNITSEEFKKIGPLETLDAIDSKKHILSPDVQFLVETFSGRSNEAVVN